MFTIKYYMQMRNFNLQFFTQCTTNLAQLFCYKYSKSCNQQILITLPLKIDISAALPFLQGERFRLTHLLISNLFSAMSNTYTARRVLLHTKYPRFQRKKSETENRTRYCDTSKSTGWI